MNETINSISAILLCIEFFLLGGSLFAYNETTKNILRFFVMIFGAAAVAVAWK